MSAPFDYLNPIIYELRSGTSTDPYQPYVSSPYKVISGTILLAEIPMKINRVQIQDASASPAINYFEIDSGVPTAFQYSVDYNTGIVIFNSAAEGKTLSVTFTGRGMAYIPASRIYTQQSDGEIIQTLQQVAQSASQFIFVGTYDSSVNYKQYNVVYYLGSSYLCLQTSTGNLPTNTIYFAKIAGYANKGVYSSFTSYGIGDIVNDSIHENVYQSLLDNNLNNSVTDTSKWQLLISVTDIINTLNTTNSNVTDAENLRVIAESDRVDAENSRVNAETNRVGAENLRASAETNRQTNESTRQTNESTRQIQETARQDGFNAYKLIEAYDNTHSYVPLNHVTYNGSTYQCIADSTGNAPTDTSYWICIAQKGANGAGTVASVTSTSGDIVTGGTQYDVTLTLNSGSGANQIVKRNASGTIDDVITITNQRGANNGIATLDGTGNVPSSQLGNVPPVNAATTSSRGTVQITASPTSGDPIVSTRTATAKDVQITSTSAQTIATYSPAANGNFVVFLYYRVVTGTTNITIKVTYADVTGAQTNIMLNAQSSAVGSYSLVPLFINASSGTAINIIVTASVANQVYASCSIMGV